MKLNILMITGAGVILFSLFACTESSRSGKSVYDSDSNLINPDDSEIIVGDTDSDSDTDADSDSDSDSDVTGGDTDTYPGYDSDNPNLTPGGSNNEERHDRLTCYYHTIEETDTTFKGEIVVGNGNTDYVWNGDVFTIYSVEFTTTSKITSAKTTTFTPITYTHPDSKTVQFDFGWMSVFPKNNLVTFEVEGTKNGQYPYPVRCLPNYIRGDVVYPEYQKLPITWWKGKVDVKESDLIKNVDDYYKEKADPITESIFVYHPPHNTQIYIGLPEAPMEDHFNKNPDGDELIVSGYTDIQMFMPSKLLAMGIGFSYQWFKFNPNYFLALGTKENFSCGLIPKATWAGGYPVTIDGKDYSWNYTLSPDGPFQQETGNFIDMAAFFPDYFPPGASHDDYTNITDPTNEYDPKWASSVVSSALSSVVTRETLWAGLDYLYGDAKPGTAAPVYDGDMYYDLVFNAKDPWAELSAVTFAYNRGIYSLCPTGFFNDMGVTLSVDSVGDKFGLSGVGDHVPQINGMVWNMNQAVDHLYDTDLTYEDIVAFFTAIRFIYQRAMTDDKWSAMLDDIKVAYDLLAAHWGGDHVSFRYDFLTLLRVAEAHLPAPTNVRPASQAWKDRITGFYCN